MVCLGLVLKEKKQLTREQTGVQISWTNIVAPGTYTVREESGCNT